jgi:hypothetical protein
MAHAVIAPDVGVDDEARLPVLVAYPEAHKIT